MDEVEIMDEIEPNVADAIAGEIDAADDATAAAPADVAPMQGGSGTLGSIHASSATSPMSGELSTQHGGTGTRPLGAGYTVAADNADINEIRAQVKADQAVTAESFRRFDRGYVAPRGTVNGLGEPSNERNKR